jgi:adenylylsulfate kinase-like enzyme
MVVYGEFIKIYCQYRVDVCETWDFKGLNKLARADGVGEFTRISLPYEAHLKLVPVVDTASNVWSRCCHICTSRVCCKPGSKIWI